MFLLVLLAWILTPVHCANLKQNRIFFVRIYSFTNAPDKKCMVPIRQYNPRPKKIDTRDNTFCFNFYSCALSKSKMGLRGNMRSKFHPGGQNLSF